MHFDVYVPVDFRSNRSHCVAVIDPTASDAMNLAIEKTKSLYSVVSNGGL